MSNNLYQRWFKVKKSGYFKRQVQKNYLKIVSSIKDSANYATTDNVGQFSDNKRETFFTPVFAQETLPTLIHTSNSNTDEAVDIEEEEIRNNWSTELENNDDEDDTEAAAENNVNAKKNECKYAGHRDTILRENLKIWAITYNIKQNALKALMQLLNAHLPNILPKDPRTFLKTPHTVNVSSVGLGQYWHQGVRSNLENIFANAQNDENISININMDGLPIYRSSKDEMWPILFNIHNMPHIKPMIIGIYCGKSKPNDLNAYIAPFVSEMKEILLNGIYINQHKITVKIRCFICDSPARAFVKGVANFNGQHGCQKCTTVGDYSYISHCNYFSRASCEKRTDRGFREKIYGSHHKCDTRLTQLPIDMIKDFPVADSLHLIDLGIMKRCLLGWRDGSFGNYRTKWSTRETTNISKCLLKCKLPSEIHRAVRGIDCLSHWKGLEYRTFLHYLGIVTLKHNVPSDVYEHFLVLFCAITICSSKAYTHLLNLAHTLLEHYVEYFRDLYGEDYMTSNIHNLVHLVDDVKHLGILPTFSAYPFESKLFQIKNMIRSGNKPLVQVAKRISELSESETILLSESTEKKIPIFKKPFDGGDLINANLLTQFNDDEISFYSKVYLERFVLSTEMENKWFLTKKGDIVGLKCVLKANNSAILYGSSVKNLKPYFETPIRSTHLNIFCSDCEENKESLMYHDNEIMCKMVAVSSEEDNSIVFIPLLHTI